MYVFYGKIRKIIPKLSQLPVLSEALKIEHLHNLAKVLSPTDDFATINIRPCPGFSCPSCAGQVHPCTLFDIVFPPSQPGRAAQSVEHLTRKQRPWVRYLVWPHTFISPSADSRGTVVSY